MKQKLILDQYKPETRNLKLFIDKILTFGSKNNSDYIHIASENELPVLLVGIEAPANYGPDYKTSFDAIYPDLATAYDTLLFPNFFEGLGEADFAALQPYFQDDGIHPNAEGVARIVEAMGPSVLTLIERAE